MIDQQVEYKSLRDEVLQGKKYVFERPLLIITICVALLKFIDKPFISFIPILMISMLLFNLWFTVNRIRSIARIVAYIQIALEESSEEEPVSSGWESSLRFYRKWVKINKDKLEEIIAENMDKDAIPDAMGYYPVIYYFHIGLVVFVFMSSLIYTVVNPVMFQFVSIVLTLSIFVSFIMYSRQCHPRKTGNFIEENRIIWNQVFIYMADTKQN